MRDPRWEVSAEAFGGKFRGLSYGGGSQEIDRSAVGGGLRVRKGPAVQSPPRDRSVGR